MLISPQHHGSTALPDHCEPVSPFLALLSSWLHTCIPTSLALTSSILGSLSILSWLFAQLPQIHRNYSLQSTAGLSVFFLVEWCLGDTANLFGAILTQQAGWQVTIAAYYVLVDIVLVFQYYWYTYCQGWGKRKAGLYSIDYRDRNGEILEGVPPVEVTSVRDMSPMRSSEPKDARPEERKLSPSPDSCSILSSNEKLGSSGPSVHRLGPGNSSLMTQQTLLLASMLCAVAVNASPTQPSWPKPSPCIDQPMSLTIGCILSWMSTILYLGSRLPQLFKNYRRQSTAGLSPLLFVAAFCGNLCYSLSLFTNPNAWYDFPPYGGGGWADGSGNNRLEWVGRAIPFFLGAAGVLTLDGLMGLQFWMYGEQGEEPVVVRVADPERGRRRWQRVTGWMRGWIPSGDSKRTPVSTDTRALLSQEHIRYGAA